MIDIDLRAMREAEKELEKRNQTIQPRICPFVTRCVKCGEPAPRWVCIACPNCGNKFDNPEVDAVSEAEHVIQDTVRKQTQPLVERVAKLERSMTFNNSVFTAICVLEIADVFIRYLM